MVISSDWPTTATIQPMYLAMAIAQQSPTNLHLRDHRLSASFDITEMLHWSNESQSRISPFRAPTFKRQKRPLPPFTEIQPKLAARYRNVSGFRTISRLDWNIHAQAR